MSFSSDNAALQAQLPLSIDVPKEGEEFNEWFNGVYQKIAASVNNKEGGLYVPEEKITSQQYFDVDNPQKNKSVYRMSIDFGALPDTGSKTVAHNISWAREYRLTRAYGASTNNDSESLPIPNDGILLEINSTSVIITTSSDLSDYEFTTVVIEYLKG